MDTLVDLLDGPRAKGAFLLRTVLDPPWSIRIEDEAPLTLVAVARGAAWLLPDHDPAVRLAPGDVAIVRGPAPYTVADDPATEPQVLIGPGQQCHTLWGEDLGHRWDLGVRTWGHDRDAADMMLTGTYQTCGEISRRLLDALPTVLVLHRDEWDCPLVDLLGAEIGRDDPGQEAVLDRLLDLLLIAALRAHLARPDTAPGWYLALADPVVGPALKLLQTDPAHQWTVELLARQVGVSRAALARRFTGLVGEPPMAFLTGWRLGLAADLLRSGATLAAVARRVGYGSPFALSTAFKRVHGVSPQQWREAG